MLVPGGLNAACLGSAVVSGPLPSLLLHCDGSDGGTTFTDSGQYGLTITRSVAVTSTTDPKFGTASAKYPSGSVIAPHHADFNPGTSADFCIDWWMKLPATPAGTFIAPWYKGALTGAGTWGCYLYTPNFGTPSVPYRLYLALGASNIVTALNAEITTGVWQHIEISRTAGRLYVFRDGIKYYDQANSSNFAGGTNTLTVGSAAGSAYIGQSSAGLEGYIDEFRYVLGAAGHTANFTPPTTPY